MLRVGAALYALALIGLVRVPDRRRRQRRPARARSSPGRSRRSCCSAAAPRRAPRVAVDAACSRRCSSTGRPTHPSPTSLAPRRTRRSTPPTTRRCSASCERSASATAGARRASRSSPPRDHWEARWVAPSVMLARGWERQLDRYRNALFYDGSPLTPRATTRGCSRSRSSYVALPDAPLDYSAKAEATAARGWAPASRRGRGEAAAVPARSLALGALAAVRRARADPARAAAGVAHAGRQRLLHAARCPRPGTFTVRLHFTPYWALAGGTRLREPRAGDWTGCRRAAPAPSVS